MDSDKIDFHIHNGVDTPLVDKNNFQNIQFQYNAKEYNNGSVSGTATIDWSKSNVQYIILTADTTLTFISPFPGIRCILQVAGGFNPTFPGTVRWPAGTTPTPTASAGHKDIYSFIYSEVESLWDGIQSANFAIT